VLLTSVISTDKLEINFFLVIAHHFKFNLLVMAFILSEITLAYSSWAIRVMEIGYNHFHSLMIKEFKI